MKTAIVIGSTGMVGFQLIQELLESPLYSDVVSLSRRPCGLTHPKLREHIIDFDQPETWSEFVKGDVLFSTLGTTQAKAGSKEAEYKVDYTYQLTVAETAARNGVASFVMVSSAGANPKSFSFYMRMKGQLDEKVMTLPFKCICIMRPGQLDGIRQEKRTSEKIGLRIMYALNKIGLFRRLKPIQARQVAKAMIAAAEKEETRIYTLGELFKLIKV